MMQKIRNREEGFTIIEVLIVLAIAGLILLIIFLAVPALQRSSRNTQRKNDASAVAGAVANYISNNGGSLPTGIANDATTNTDDLCSAGGVSDAASSATACTAGTNLETAKLGIFAQTGVWLDKTGQAAITTAAIGSESTTKVSVQSIIVDEGYACNATNTGVGSANTRTAAILYVTETGSGNGSLQCVEQ